MNLPEPDALERDRPAAQRLGGRLARDHRDVLARVRERGGEEAADAARAEDRHRRHRGSRRYRLRGRGRRRILTGCDGWRLLAVVIVALSAGPASAAALLRQPAWAKPLIAQLAQAMSLPHATMHERGAGAACVPPPTVRGFTCYVDAIGSAIALGAGNPCDRPASALPILGP